MDITAWVLIWLVVSSQGMTSGAAYFGSEKACDEAALALVGGTSPAASIAVNCTRDSATPVAE